MPSRRARDGRVTHSMPLGVAMVSSPKTPRTRPAINSQTWPSLLVMGGEFLPSPLTVTLPRDVPAGVKTRAPNALYVRSSDLMTGSSSAVTSAWYSSTVSSKPSRVSMMA